MRSGKKIVFCPICKKPGFISERFVWSTWKPAKASAKVEALKRASRELSKRPRDKRLRSQVESLRESVSGQKYGGKFPNDSPDNYRIRSYRVRHFYVGHYDAELYARQKRDYQNGKRKSKPSGRKWCYVDKETAKMLKDTFLID